MRWALSHSYRRFTFHPRLISQRRRSVLVSAIGTLLAGCGGGGSPSAPQRPVVIAQVLATVDGFPAVSLFNTAPGNTITVSVTPRDKTGAAFTGVTSQSFSTNNAGIATVNGDGMITAVSPGAAEVTVTVSAGGVTLRSTGSVEVRVPPASVTVTAPQFTFEPHDVHVMAGGSVTWAIASIHHTVTFATPGAPPDAPETQNESVSRTFTKPGSYTYGCSLHAGMSGTVHVH